MIVGLIKFTVRGKTLGEICGASHGKLSEFMPDEPITKWRVVIETHEHADDGEWIGHVTARPARRVRDEYDEFDF